MKNKYLSILNDITQDDKADDLQLNSKVLLIDGMNTFLRCFSVVNIINSSGENIGAIATFLKSVALAIRTLKPTRVIIVFDGENSSNNRKNLYSEYKSNRGNTRITTWEGYSSHEEETLSATEQLMRSKDYLEQLPVDIIDVPKLEADDVIGYMVDHDHFKNSEIIVLSSDKDFFQLINDRVSVYLPTPKKLYKTNTVLEEFSVHPTNFVMYKTLLGDSSDNIPGVKGLGIKKFKKFFPELLEEKRYSLQEIVEKSKEKEGSSMVFDNIIRFEPQLKINEQLVSLKDQTFLENDLIKIDALVEGVPNSMYMDVIMLMYEEDKLERELRNIEEWLMNSFGNLNKYIEKYGQ